MDLGQDAELARCLAHKQMAPKQQLGFLSERHTCPRLL